MKSAFPCIFVYSQTEPTQQIFFPFVVVLTMTSVSKTSTKLYCKLALTRAINDWSCPQPFRFQLSSLKLPIRLPAFKLGCICLIHKTTKVIRQERNLETPSWNKSKLILNYYHCSTLSLRQSKYMRNFKVNTLHNTWVNVLITFCPECVLLNISWNKTCEVKNDLVSFFLCLLLFLVPSFRNRIPRVQRVKFYSRVESG